MTALSGAGGANYGHLEQGGFDLRLEWGGEGVTALGAGCAVLVVVDVLVFTTTVDVALGRGGRVLPLPWRDERAEQAAEAAGAVLLGTGLAGAAPTRSAGWSLRPSSLGTLPAGTLLGVPSPNGATLCAAAERTGATVLAGCLRNATAVATAAAELADGEPIGIVPAGERWHVPERPLRPGIEDLLGAGAIAAAVPGHRAPSAEASLAASTYRAAAGRVGELLRASVSGRELVAAGVPDDVVLASDVDCGDVVPVLADGVFG